MSNQTYEKDNKPIKPLAYKPYGSLGHVSMSKLTENDFHIDNGQERLIFEKAFKPQEFRAYIFVQEKVDGSNCSVVNLNGEMVGLSRAGYRCSDSQLEQHKMFADWVKANEDRLKILLPEHENRCVGEWVAQAHGQVYHQLDLIGRRDAGSPNDPYIIFDWFHKEHDKVNTLTMLEKVRKANLTHVITLPAFTAEEFSYFEFYMKAARDSILAGHRRQDRWEGFVFKVERMSVKKDKEMKAEFKEYLREFGYYYEDDSFGANHDYMKNNLEPLFMAKYVKHDFKTGQYIKNSDPERTSKLTATWNWRPETGWVNKESVTPSSIALAAEQLKVFLADYYLEPVLEENTFIKKATEMLKNKE